MNSAWSLTHTASCAKVSRFRPFTHHLEVFLTCHQLLEHQVQVQFGFGVSGTSGECSESPFSLQQKLLKRLKNAAFIVCCAFDLGPDNST